MRVELFHGPVTTTEATFYAQVPRPSGAGEWRLQGKLHGPANRLANTLPATLQMKDAGPGDTVLARVRVADPCGWSMDLPALYQVDLELTCDGEVSQSWEAITGFRDFGATGRSFSLNGERWVVRGEFSNAQDDFNVQKWRDERLVCVCTSPSETDLRAASEEGAYLIVQLEGNSATEWADQLRRVATWPAVLAVTLPQVPTKPIDFKMNTSVAIGCFAGQVDMADEAVKQVDFVCVDERWLLDAAKLLSTDWFADLPVVAVGSEVGGRAACDRLQAKLAPGNYAGYLVGGAQK